MKSGAHIMLHPSNSYLSPGGLFQLSTRSIATLIEKDKANYIQAVYDNEIISKQEADRLGVDHMQLLKLHHR